MISVRLVISLVVAVLSGVTIVFCPVFMGTFTVRTVLPVVSGVPLVLRVPIVFMSLMIVVRHSVSIHMELLLPNIDSNTVGDRSSDCLAGPRLALVGGSRVAKGSAVVY